LDAVVKSEAAAAKLLVSKDEGEAEAGQKRSRKPKIGNLFPK
jgi:hypothetical protein